MRKREDCLTHKFSLCPTKETMIRILALLFTAFLYGCTTNQLHFADYTPEAELKKIIETETHVEIIDVWGAETCERCDESSKIVWHVANKKSGLYEGFFPIPVENWREFTKLSVGSKTGSSTKAKVEIKRVFLKTWQNPQYYACHTEILIHINNRTYLGESMIKISGAGQELPRYNLAVLNPAVFKAISLSIKSAYINAASKMQSH
ncbi:hypothetical protein [Pseudomonas sp. URMO17WK12:I4]|uniref:hypothetical protein n=1 Tax=Pseudomonas sp. URMO17WK12:I4 TaxID=1283292 RepID=UPI0012DBFE3C|nr:hypothetical protein [Pseudomonas sp. URMO17WK12:I4]